MSKSIKIPDTMNPFVVILNGKKYVYEAGATETVPDEVAELIESIPAPASAPAVEAPWEVPEATEDAAGVVLQGEAVADAASTAPTAAEFKALLDSLRASGAIATAEE